MVNRRKKRDAQPSQYHRVPREETMYEWTTSVTRHDLSLWFNLKNLLTSCST